MNGFGSHASDGKGYIVIHAMEHGVAFREYSADEFEAEVAKGAMGYFSTNPQFLEKIKEDVMYSDRDFRHGEFIVIKGHVVVPKAVEKVTVWKLQE